MNDWFENEAFWVQYAPIMFDIPRWKEAPAVAEGIFKLADTGRLPQELKILDAGCGLGRIAVELAVLGAQVTGVDLIKPFLDAAAEAAAAENVTIEWVQADLRKVIPYSPILRWKERGKVCARIGSSTQKTASKPTIPLCSASMLQPNCGS